MPISSSPFFNPTNNYGWTGPTPFANTPLGDVFQNETNPEAAFTRWLAEQGYGGVDTRSEQARSLYNRFTEGFGAVKTNNPGAKWTDYLAGMKLPDIFAGMSPAARGEQETRYVGPVRWQLRQE